LLEKAANSRILLQKQNCFREQVSRVQIFTASKNFYFDQQKLLFGLIVFSQKRDMDRETSRHRRFATPPNTEYIFSQLAVIMKP